MSLRDLKTIAGLQFDLRYATANNVTGKPIYKAAHAFLHEKAYTQMQKAVILAKNIGLGFKIFDAYRPPEGQQALWDFCPDPDYVMDPAKGSHHTRGVAVDLTLVDARGIELDMGTDFDDFRTLAHHAQVSIPIEAQRNRFILLGIMSAAGWDFYKNEWWHYQLFDPRSYPLITDAEAPLSMMNPELIRASG